MDYCKQVYCKCGPSTQNAVMWPQEGTGCQPLKLWIQILSSFFRICCNFKMIAKCLVINPGLPVILTHSCLSAMPFEDDGNGSSNNVWNISCLAEELWELDSAHLKKNTLLDYRIKFKNTKANSRTQWGREGERKVRKGGRKREKKALTSDSLCWSRIKH